MNRRILFLDDDPDRHRLIAKALPNARHVHTANEAIRALQNKIWDVVFLDHDLDQFGAENPGTGEDVADWVIAHAERFRHTLFIIHSHNWIFGPVMERKLRAAGLSALRYRAAETDRFFLNKVGVGALEDITAAVTDPDNLKIPTKVAQ